MSLITDRDVRCYRDLGRLHIVIEQFLGKELWESYTTYSDSEARCYKLHLLIEARCYKLHIVIERLVVTSSLLQATYSDRGARCYKLHILIERQARCYKLPILIEGPAVTSYIF